MKQGDIIKKLVKLFGIFEIFIFAMAMSQARELALTFANARE